MYTFIDTTSPSRVYPYLVPPITLLIPRTAATGQQRDAKEMANELKHILATSKLITAKLTTKSEILPGD
ncbi:predicted protein [Sclerotinia sclerotiorum 1980 UF-70]|uniref:Uncharacterized protein n=1 Tax=Sclerotinia sclerotiorum (strain ATCC 18683 / 1980 / Ss-1) TaxID=665079 RepID=A7F3Z1_SCLS1|nr:predicted protein [Sclerotinia sclerotiorum 1980 UF-70]EDN97462.1 predicted protein [Sclerotinia sclerotiorum 1980 UF-70]